MKAISKSALVLLCFAMLPSLSACASPSGNQDPDENKPVIIVTNNWWFQVKWILPPRMGNDFFYWLNKSIAESMGYDTVENDDNSYPASRK